jgi:hypothetical protein
MSSLILVLAVLEAVDVGAAAIPDQEAPVHDVLTRASVVEERHGGIQTIAY